MTTFEPITSGRADSDRHFARDFVLPAARGVADEDGRAGGQRGQKGHDGDDSHQGAPRDRGCGHQRHIAVAAAPETTRYVTSPVPMPDIPRRHLHPPDRAGEKTHRAPQS